MIYFNDPYFYLFIILSSFLLIYYFVFEFKINDLSCNDSNQIADVKLLFFSFNFNQKLSRTLSLFIFIFAM